MSSLGSPYSDDRCQKFKHDARGQKKDMEHSYVFSSFRRSDLNFKNARAIVAQTMTVPDHWSALAIQAKRSEMPRRSQVAADFDMSTATESNLTTATILQRRSQTEQIYPKIVIRFCL